MTQAPGINSFTPQLELFPATHTSTIIRPINTEILGSLYCSRTSSHPDSLLNVSKITNIPEGHKERYIYLKANAENGNGEDQMQWIATDIGIEQDTAIEETNGILEKAEIYAQILEALTEDDINNVQSEEPILIIRHKEGDEEEDQLIMISSANPRGKAINPLTMDIRTITQEEDMTSNIEPAYEVIYT